MKTRLNDTDLAALLIHERDAAVERAAHLNIAIRALSPTGGASQPIPIVSDKARTTAPSTPARRKDGRPRKKPSPRVERKARIIDFAKDMTTPLTVGQMAQMLLEPGRGKRERSLWQIAVYDNIKRGVLESVDGKVYGLKK